MRWNWPYVDFWLNIGILRIATELMHERTECLTREYIAVTVVVFWRYGFRFRLYSPMR